METSEVNGPICCICRQGGENLSLMCYVHKTKITDFQTTGEENTLDLFNRFRNNMEAKMYQNETWKSFGGKKKSDGEFLSVDDPSPAVLNREETTDIFLRDAEFEEAQHNAKTVLKTCGHYIHIQCHRANSGKPPENIDVVFDSSSACPMCRCFFTVLLPTGSSDKNVSAHYLSTKTIDDKINLIQETNAVKPDYEAAERDFLYYFRILQSLRQLGSKFNGTFYMGHCLSAIQDMLELDILSIECDAENHHRTPLLEFFDNARSKLPLEIGNYARHLNLLFQVLHNEMSLDMAFGDEKFTPVLVLDPKRILILLTLSMKSTLSPTLFQSFVRTLFNLSFVQACVKIVIEDQLFSPDDFTDLKQTGLILSRISSRIRSEKELFGINTNTDYISSTVLTKSALLEKVLQYMTPFIKMTALLCYHIFPHTHSMEPYLKWKTKTDILNLCCYIGLKDGPDSMDTNSSFDLVDLFDQKESYVQNLLQNYMNAAKLNARKHPSQPPTVFLLNSAVVLRKPVFFNIPKLLKPPKLFRDLLNSCLKTPCQACGKLPKKSVICLVCGELLCYNEHDGRSHSDNPCLEMGNMSPIKDHIEKCSSGNGIFFVLFDVSILIIRNNMILRRWGSIYLDKYEEEDFKIRRGKPLYLSETRFNILQKIWISSAFPSESPRQNRERFGFTQLSSTWQRMRDNL